MGMGREDLLDAPYRCPNGGRCRSVEPFASSHRCSAVPTMKSSASSGRGLAALAEILAGTGMSAKDVREALGVPKPTPTERRPRLAPAPWHVTVSRRSP
jgi:hypothetical protein